MAPFDGPKLRRGWETPFDAGELQRFAELYAAGRAAGVEVIVGVAPARLRGVGGLNARRDRDGNGVNDDQWPRLRDKFLSLQDVGGRGFLLAFDYTLPSYFSSTATLRAARLHAKAARLVLFALRERDPEAFVWLTPAVDHGAWDALKFGAPRYWMALGRDLPPAVRVLWTGPRRRSPRIRAEVAARLARATGLQLVAVARDPEDDRLTGFAQELMARRPRSAWRALKGRALRFGPRDTIDPELIGNAAAVLVEGAPEAGLTRVVLACFAETIADGAAYDPIQAHGRALARVSGAAAPDLTLLYRLVQRQGRRLLIEGLEVDLEDLVSRSRRSRDGEAREMLRRALRVLRGLPARLREGLGDDPLWREVAPSAEKIAALAALGLKALVAEDAKAAGHAVKAKGLRRECRRAAKALRRTRPLVAMGPIYDLIESP